MNKSYRKYLLALSLLPALGLAQGSEPGAEINEDPGYPDEIVVQVADVPEHVVEVADEVRPGAYYARIRKIWSDDDELYYVFDASQVGKYWIIRVRNDGKLISVNEESEAPNFSRD